MGLLSGNSCNIITILPLGLSCDSINASTPDATNGLIALFVTGGTPPYTINWDNGLQGSPITNLLPGNYVATVSDYYGDFTATTTCNVGYNSFYIEKFKDCSAPSNFIYYLADLPSTFISGKTYNLTTQNGCWVSSGTTLYTGETYYNYFAETNYQPYNDCVSCLPPPIPPVIYPSKLCMTVSSFLGNSTSQINFSSGNTINGYPSWTSVTPSYAIYYNTGMTRWEVLSWSGSGVPSFNFPSAPPLGSWSVNGAPLTNVNVVTGTCVSIPMTIVCNKTNPTCDGVNDGVISVITTGGIPTYTYSINGITYQPSSTFIGLSAGIYTIYVKDSLNNIVTQSVTLVPMSSVVNYVLNLSLTPLSVQTNIGTTSTKTWYWRIDVTPTLPPTQTISFNINFAVNMTGSTLGFISTTTDNVINGTPINTSTLGLPVVGPVTSSSTILNKPCESYIKSVSAYTTTYSASITGNGYITGTTVQTITTPTLHETTCALTGTITDTMTINILSLLPNTCSTLSNVVPPLYMSLTKNGLVAVGREL